MTDLKHIVALSFLVVGLGSAAPAQAKLHDVGVGGSLSGGVFHGIPVRPQKRAARIVDPDVTGGVADRNCHTVRQSSHDASGALVMRVARICE